MAARTNNTFPHFAIFARRTYKLGTNGVSICHCPRGSAFWSYLGWQDIYEKGEKVEESRKGNS
jgi:hypothetical protein